MSTHPSLANLYFFQTGYDKARLYLEQSLTLRRKIHNRTGIANDLSWMGHICMAQKDYPQARQYYQEMLVIGQDLNKHATIGYALHDLGWLTFFEKDYLKAKSLFGRASLITKFSVNKLALIVGMASVQAFIAPDGVAVEHMSRVFNDPSTVLRIKELAELGRVHLEATLSKEEYEASWERGKSLDVDIIFQQLVTSISDEKTSIRQTQFISDETLLANQQLLEPLTQREVEVLHLVADGYSNKEICEHLVLSKNTIRTHLKNLYSKLGADSRTRAVAMARNKGLL